VTWRGPCLMPVFQPSFLINALAILLTCAAICSCGDAAMAREAGPPQQKPLEPMPDGDRLARLLKKITDEGLLNDPARLAAELDIEMTFKTRPAPVHEKSCEEGGSQRSTTLTEATIGSSWYRAGPEGVPDMKVPQFMSDKVYVAKAPRVEYRIFRGIMCKTGHEKIEARLTFLDVSAYACLTPERLGRVIGTTYAFHNHGWSSSSYEATPTDYYGTTLRFHFQAGAPCATSVTIDQNTRDSARQMRGFIKWRTCYDKARLDYCTAHPGTGGEHDNRMDRHGQSVCGDSWMDYVDREPFSGEPAPPYEIVDDPCGTGR
jgi:hypothetical protein